MIEHDVLREKMMQRKGKIEELMASCPLNRWSGSLLREQVFDQIFEKVKIPAKDYLG